MSDNDFIIEQNNYLKIGRMFLIPSNIKDTIQVNFDPETPKDDKYTMSMGCLIPKYTMSLGWAIDAARSGAKVKCNLECASEDYLYVKLIDNSQLSGFFEIRHSGDTLFRIQHHYDCKWTEYVEGEGNEIKRNAIERGKALIAKMTENRTKKLKEIQKINNDLMILTPPRYDENYIKFLEILEQDGGIDA